MMVYMHLLIAALLSSAVAAFSLPLYNVKGSGWASPTWNWGSAVGTGHDCANICRSNYSTEGARTHLIDSLLKGDGTIDLEEVKLILALVIQKANNLEPWGGQVEVAYSQILDHLVEAERYEDALPLLLQDLQKIFKWLGPEMEDTIEMNLLLYDAKDDYELATRKCCGLTLKAMEFAEFGL